MLREIERILRFRVRNWRYVECITYKICLEYICKQTPTWLIQTCLHLVCVLYINLMNASMPWMSTTRWEWHACDISLVVYSSVHLSLFFDYRTDNMDFDNYAHESSYGGHDPGMYSSDPYGQSYSPHLPNGGQYYQDERSPHGSRVSLHSGGSNRNLSRMVRN